jgi:hypothetical protein
MSTRRSTSSTTLGAPARGALVALCLVAVSMALPGIASAQRGNLAPARIDEVAPNPLVAGTTRISFIVPSAGSYNIRIFSVDGALVASVLESEAQGKGEYFATWDGRGIDGSLLANGIYFCRLQFGTLVQAVPVVIMR